MKRQYKFSLVILTFLAANVAQAADWKTSETRDEMRGTTSRVHSLKSEPTRIQGRDVQFSFMMITRMNDGNAMLAFSVFPRDLINCIRTCDIAYKIDENPIQTRGAQTDSSYKVVSFIADQQTLSAIAQGSSMLVELPLYQKGSRQYKFELGTLPDELREMASTPATPQPMQPVN